MINNTTKYNAEDLLNQLDKEGIITDNKKEQLSEFIINQQSKQELPLHLRVLLGIGAFVTSIFIIGFLLLSGTISEDEITLIVWGLIFIIGAIGSYKISTQENNSTITNSFFTQFSFTSMMIGKTLFVIGVVVLNSDINYEYDLGWIITWSLLVISAVVYPLYKISLDRFLSPFVILYSILLNITIFRYDSDDNHVSMLILISSLFLFQFIGSAILLTYHKIKRDYIPLSYAFVLSLCTTVLYLQIRDIHLIFVNMILALGLISLFVWVLGDIKKLNSEPLILVSTGALILGLLSAPGILLAIGLLILGYYKHEKILIRLGITILPVVLIFYYYNLDSSLIQKSFILMGSGVLLLLGRLHLKYKQWDKGY